MPESPITLLLAAAGLLAVLAIAWILVFNALTRARLACDTAWSLVDVQLRRRHDLVPNLVAVVGAYAAHERAVLQAVTEARVQAESTPDAPTPETAAAERTLGRATGAALALAEAYPQLQADAQFLNLQHELADLEDQIQASREIYNHNVASYRTQIQQWPTSLVARRHGFEDPPLFSLDPAAATSVAPPVA